MKRWGCIAGLLFIGMVLVLITVIVIVIGRRPCGWIDVALESTGCKFKIASPTITEMTFSPDGSYFATLAVGNIVQLWNPNDGTLLHILERENDVTVHGIAISPDGMTLAVVLWSTIEIWQATDATLLKTLITETDFQNIAFSSDWEFLASGVSGGRLEIIQLDNGKLLHSLEEHKYVTQSVSFSPDSELLASGGGDGLIRLWQVSDGKMMHNLEGHSRTVEDLTFSPDGTILASASIDNTVKLWRVSDGELLHILQGDTGNILSPDSVYSIAFSPDGTILASGESSVAQLWRVSDGQLLHTFNLGSLVWDVDFSPDGKTLATAQLHGPVRFFDLEQIGLLD